MNEPRHPESAPAGPARRSSTVDRSMLPAVAQRERVEALLRTHDLVDAERAFDEIGEADQAVVRLIAGESAAFGTEPPVRYSAIAALGHRPSAENLNLLTDLARFGDDFYVRGHAMLALAHTGTYAHLEPILRGLTADESFERAAATKALTTLARHTSTDAIRTHALAIGGTELAERVTSAVAESDNRAAQRPATPAQTSEQAS